MAIPKFEDFLYPFLYRLKDMDNVSIIYTFDDHINEELLDLSFSILIKKDLKHIHMVYILEYTPTIFYKSYSMVLAVN